MRARAEGEGEGEGKGEGLEEPRGDGLLGEPGEDADRREEVAHGGERGVELLRPRVGVHAGER